MVLFFFSILKSGIETNQAVQKTEDFISGKITKEAEDKSRIRIQQIDQALSEMEIRKNTIVANEKELMALVEQFKGHQVLVGQLVKEVKEKSSSLVESNKTVQQLRAEIHLNEKKIAEEHLLFQNEAEKRLQSESDNQKRLAEQGAG
jgi:hypothetical protein